MQKNSSINYSKLSVSMNSKGRLFKEKIAFTEIHIKEIEIE